MLLLFPFSALIWAQDFGDRFEVVLLERVGVKDSLFWDAKSGLLLTCRMYKGQVLDTVEIAPIPLDLATRFLTLSKSLIREEISESLRVAAAAGEGEGLIPDIEIPIALPKGLGFLGEGGKLKIEGRQDILFGGRTSYFTDQASSEYGAPSRFPQLEMDQKLQVKLTGSVGEKIQVLVDHDSQRENQLKNKVRLRYQGFEDEVIQVIEAGDTRLTLPQTSYTGFSGGGREGLFGIKMESQLGALKIQTIASREQGETQQRTFSPGARSDSLAPWAKDFERHRFFHLSEEDSISRLEVFVDDGNGNNDSISGARRASVYFYPPSTDIEDSLFYPERSFNWLQPNQDYLFDFRSNLLELLSPLQDNHILAVYYETFTGNTVGDLTDSTHYRLKLIRPIYSVFPLHISRNPSVLDSIRWSILWDHEVKNIYSLRARDLLPDELEVKILKVVSGTHLDGEGGRSYLEIFGLDSDRDGRIDDATVIGGQRFRILYPDRGYLVFPNRFPFADTLLNEPDTVIYWKRSLLPTEGQTYYLSIKYKERANTITLGAINIIEGSEVIKWKGKALVRGSDYNIDYESGVITLLNKDVIDDPNADLQVTFDYAPFLSLKQKSLVGTRLDYTFSERLRLGSTWIMRSEGTVNQRPRIGEEPVRAALGELDLFYDADLPGVTQFLNQLPFLHAEGGSHLRLRGEAARAFPNPNTRGAAYLDDMEAVKLSLDLPTSRTSWIYGSIPEGRDTTGLVRLVWANPPNWVKVGDVFPNLSEEEKNDNLSVLALMVDGSVSIPPFPWVGLNTLLSPTSSDFTTMEFLELWLKGEGATLHIDLGYNIPEDAVWRDRGGRLRGYHGGDPNILDTEDQNKNGQLEFDEDVGLDTIGGNDGDWPNIQEDDGNDDYDFRAGSSDFSKINGTEGNRRLDTEDLNGDRLLEMDDRYFEFSIDLNGGGFIQPETTFASGFKYYRIPIKDSRFYTPIGSPSWDLIRYARIWLSDFTGAETLLVAKTEVTGSKWENFGLKTLDSLSLPDSSEKFMIGLVNSKDHSHQYTPPPGIQLKRDPQRGSVEREQSLSLSYRNLREDHMGVAHRGLFDQNDLLNYKKIRFFVRPAKGVLPPYPVVFLRFGTDTLNYYEYRVSNLSGEWQEIQIDLDDLAAFKKTVLDTTQDSSGIFIEGAHGFRGRPTLSQIRMYEFGVLNGSGTTLDSGEVWLDELRVVSPRREGGLAFQGGAELNLSDWANLQLSYTQEEANFQRLTEVQPSRSTQRSYSLRSNWRLDRFFPKEWGFSIPVTYSRDQSLSFPKFETGTDVLLNSKQREEEQTFRFSEDFDLRLSKTGSRGSLLRWIVDPFALNGSLRRSQDLSPLAENRGQRLALRTSYNFKPTLSKPPKILGQEISYLPTSYSLSLGYTKDSTRSLSLVSGSTTEKLDRFGEANASIGMNPLRNLSGSYNQSRTHNLALDPENRYGREISRGENLAGSYSINFFSFLAPSLRYSSSYTESRNRHLADTLGGQSQVRDVNQALNVGVEFPLELPRLLRVFGPPAKPPSDTLKQASPFGVRGVLGRLSQIIRTPRVGYTFSRSSSFFSVLERPVWRYRLGLSEDPGITSQDPRAAQITSQAYDLSGGLDLSPVSFGYRGSLSISDNRASGSHKLNRSLAWPQLDLSLASLEKFLPFKGPIVSASLRSSFERRTTETKDQLHPSYRSETNDLKLSPSLSMDLKGGVQANLGVNMSQGKTENFGIGKNWTEARGRGANLSLNYTFKNPTGFKLPFLGGRFLRIRSDLSTQLQFSLDESRQEQTGIPIRDGLTRTISFSASYSFSRSVNGNLTFDHKTSEDRILRRSHRDIGLIFNASFKF